MDVIEVAGLRIAYERSGEGPPLVLLHGILGDSRMWRGQLRDLSDEFTVVAWDAPGCGQSSAPPEAFRLPDYADCLAEFIDALGLRRPHVLGLSLGGALALEFYRLHPAVPRTLVLAAAYAGWAGSLPAEVVEQRLQQCLREADLPADEWVRDWIPGLLTESAPTALVDLVVATMSEFNPVGFRVMAHALAEADLRDVLPHIDVPTLLLYGDLDRRSPLRVAKDLHARIPASTLVTLPGVGHLSNMEAAGLFNTEVRRFLRSQESK
jgi:pimeloyl-ACP methyl ester carboxylesterase